MTRYYISRRTKIYYKDEDTIWFFWSVRYQMWREAGVIPSSYDKEKFKQLTEEEVFLAFL